VIMRQIIAWDCEGDTAEARDRRARDLNGAATTRLIALYEEGSRERDLLVALALRVQQDGEPIDGAIARMKQELAEIDAEMDRLRALAATWPAPVARKRAARDPFLDLMDAAEGRKHRK